VPAAAWIAQAHGWRAAFICAGVSGFAVAGLIALFVREPKAGGSEAIVRQEERSSIRETLRQLARSGTYVSLAVGSAFMATFVYISTTWEASFLARVHGLGIAEAALLLGPVRGAAGAAGLVLGGLTARRLGSHEGRRAMILPISALCLAICEAVFLLADSPLVWGAALAVGGVFLTFHLGTLYSLLSIVVAPRMRGVAVSLFLLVGSLVGQLIGPVLVGFVTDRLSLSFGDESLRYSLMIAVVCVLGGSAFFLRAARRVKWELGN